MSGPDGLSVRNGRKATECDLPAAGAYQISFDRTIELVGTPPIGR
jgi:hypothetical protein